MRDASLERASYGSLLDSPAFGAHRDRGTTRRPTIPRQGSGRRVSTCLAVTRAVTAGGHPLPFRRARFLLKARTRRRRESFIDDLQGWSSWLRTDHHSGL